jgi:serine phosphatase RsbU (regulator of sigma subunit)
MNEHAELYGSARLMEVLATAGPDPKGIISAIRDDVRRFAGVAEQSDDLTLLCVRRNGN